MLERSSIPRIRWERGAEPGLISVVTVARNDRRGLLRTLESLQAQDHGRCEHIVIDGDSTDGTTDLLRAWKSDALRWQSEPDGGIADAFNRGLLRARGEWIQFLNAGDTYSGPSALGAMAEHLETPGIVTGFSRVGESTIPERVLTGSDILRRRALISHQATLTHRQIFFDRGGFDTGFRVRMDYEFWLRVLPRYPFTFIDEVFVEYRGGGVSERQRKAFHREERLANRRHLRSPAGANLKVFLRPLWFKINRP